MFHSRCCNGTEAKGMCFKAQHRLFWSPRTSVAEATGWSGTFSIDLATDSLQHCWLLLSREYFFNYKIIMCHGSIFLISGLLYMKIIIFKQVSQTHPHLWMVRKRGSQTPINTIFFIYSKMITYALPKQ